MTDVVQDAPAVRPLRRRVSVGSVVDYAFFVFAAASAIWLAWLVLVESPSWGWWQLLLYVAFWVLLAYLVLPRVHRILTAIYVPGYFIGRARTSDGLLGDPINLAVLGDPRQLAHAMGTAGWTRADPITLHTTRRIISSTLLRRSYDEAPVSPLLLFDREQDVAYQQEVKGNPAKRHHVRFWRCPDDWLLPGGYRADWLAAGTFDRSVGLSLFTLQVTHKIDANTDIERDHIVSTVEEAVPAASVTLIKDFSTGYHSRNGGGDAIVTDGDLPVIDLRAVAVPPAAEVAPILVDTSWQRPTAIWLGSALMLFRVIAAIAAIPLVMQDISAALATEPSVSEADQATVTWFAIGSVSLLAALYLLLTVFVFRGSEAARILTMTLCALVVVTSAVDFFAEGIGISLRANLLGLPLDILVLLALTAPRARVWSRMPRAARRRPKAAHETATA